jgi:hypothetical protein
VIHAVARPEFQRDVLELLRAHGALVNTEGDCQGTLSIEPAASTDDTETLKLEDAGVSRLATVHRGILIDFLRAHEQWVGNKEATDNGRYNQELADAILDIVMKEEDTIEAEWKVGAVVRAYEGVKSTVRRWMIAAGVAGAVAAGAVGVAGNYAGEEISDDMVEWADDAGESLEGAQHDFERWWDKTFGDDKSKKKKRGSKK